MALRHRAVVEFAYIKVWWREMMPAATRIGIPLKQLFDWQEARMKIIAKIA
jgi:hypothetical protein